MIPNFYVIGAAKAATTSLCGLIASHPDVFFCPVKEPGYFTYDYGRGVDWYELAHDRLIKPVKKSNAIWRQANLSLLQRQADLWMDASQSVEFLLGGTELQNAERWAAAHEGEPIP